jgi:hypothetical protein
MGGIMKLCNKDVCLAMCQMGVLDIIFNSGATMDLEQAIIQH